MGGGETPPPANRGNYKCNINSSAKSMAKIQYTLRLASRCFPNIKLTVLNVVKQHSVSTQVLNGYGQVKHIDLTVAGESMMITLQ